MGAKAFSLVKLVQFRPGEIAVEIGSERGEGSTEYLSRELEGLAEFFSVDIVKRTEQTIVEDGAIWLKGNEKPIKFAYLDNYDYIFEGFEDASWVEQQRIEYESLGYELNNKASEVAHLEQVKIIDKTKAPKCLIVIDDTWFKEGEYCGKGAKATPYLLDKGWQVLNEVSDNSNGYVALRSKR